MSHIITRRRILGVFEHVFAIVVGFVLMVLGLGLSVTMIMLPVGLVVGWPGSRCSSRARACDSTGSEPRHAEPSPRRRVLVVDDELLIRWTLWRRSKRRDIWSAKRRMRPRRAAR
jgi:hypothetical protein